MFYIGARKAEKSRRPDHSLSRHDERRLYVHSRCRALEGNPKAPQDYYASHPAGDGVWVLHC